MFTNMMRPERMRRANTYSMLLGAHDFVQRHKGTPTEADPAGVVINESYVVNNSLHVERGRGSYLPNNAATSESQVQLAVGYLECYKATGLQMFFDEAIKYADAYLKYYFIGYLYPSRVGAFRAHWVINGKYPFKTWGPIDYRDYQNSGGFTALVPLSNGVGTVPHGQPWHGEKTMRVYRAYTPNAVLQWRNILAGLGGWNPEEVEDPSTGELRAVEEFEIEWYIDIDGNPWDGEGVELESVPAEGLVGGEPMPGRFKTKNATPSGDYNIVFANESGHEIARNAGFDAWPMWRALATGESNSAFDAELWHTELFRDLAEITGEVRWLTAWNSALFSINEAKQVEAQNVYFERNRLLTYPYSRGVSYSYHVGINSRGKTTRDNDGWIRIEKDQEIFKEDNSWSALEQVGLLLRMNPQSKIVATYGTTQTTGHASILLRVREGISQTETRTYRVSQMFPGGYDAPVEQTFGVKNLVADEHPDGSGYKTLLGPASVGFGDWDAETLEGFIIDRQDLYRRITIKASVSGYLAGFWMNEPKTLSLPQTITYRTITGQTLYARVKDANGWLWWRTLPASINWGEVTLDWADLTISRYQANTGTPPATPAPAPVELVEFLPDPDAPREQVLRFDIYCIGDRPEKLTLTDFIADHLFLRFHDWREYVVRVGDVYADDYPPLDFPYAPGVVPFTYDKTQYKGQKFWRGTPYVGYQYPSVWAENGQLDDAYQVVQFYKDAQDHYDTTKDIRGPWTPVYYWPKWDNVRYGNAAEFGFPGPDPNTFWGGFQARTYHAAAHLWVTLVNQGDAVPSELPAVVEDYTIWLDGFLETSLGNRPPTEFPENEAPFAGYDEPHIASLNLVAAIYARRAGSTHPAVQRVIDYSYDFIARTYVQVGDVRGSFSPDPENRVYYGFWHGEIMRGLAVYYEEDFERLGEPIERQPLESNEVELEDGSGVLLLESGSSIVYNFAAPVILVPMTLESGEADYLVQEDGTSFITLE